MKTKTSLLLLLFISCIQQADAQSFNTASICDNKNMVLQRLRGDSVFITCDTAYKLTKNTFHFLIDKKNSHENLSASVNSMLDLVSTGDSLYINYVEELNKQYEAINKEFKSLADTSNGFINMANTHIDQINTQLDSVNRSLESVNKYVTDAKEILEKENKNRWKTKLGWGVGGLTVGVGISSLLLLVVK